MRALHVRGPLLPCSAVSGQRERFEDHSVALGFEGLVADSVGPGCSADGLADSVAVTRVRLAWIGSVPVEESCLEFRARSHGSGTGFQACAACKGSGRDVRSPGR